MAVEASKLTKQTYKDVFEGSNDTDSKRVGMMNSKYEAVHKVVNIDEPDCTRSKENLRLHVENRDPSVENIEASVTLALNHQYS